LKPSQQTQNIHQIQQIQHTATLASGHEPCKTSMANPAVTEAEPAVGQHRWPPENFDSRNIASKLLKGPKGETPFSEVVMVDID
jgi:hypothetical protein